MSERKVLTKYYPPDFDPRELGRKRGPKQSGPKTQQVRIMAPFSMKCLSCGEYIYKGRKFNSRKETPNEKYLGIQVFHFHLKCTRCSSPIIVKTDPRLNDYSVVQGAIRNMEPWRNREAEAETDEQRLNRLEMEEAEAADEEADARGGGGKTAMADLEAKNEDAKREMAAADALDEIQQRNARIQRSEKDGVDFSDYVVRPEDGERERLEREDEEAARRAFSAPRERNMVDYPEEEIVEDIPLAASSASASAASSSGAGDDAASSSYMADVTAMPPPPPPSTFKRAPKKKVDFAAKLGIKKKPSLV